MFGLGVSDIKIKNRVRACDYLTVAQLFLQDNFLLERELSFDDVKPRLLGHWGTCHGINLAYANLAARGEMTDFVLGPGHGFPALQANLFLDGALYEVDRQATRDLAGLRYICRNFSWPGGFPSHASPLTPGVISEGGELGYALATGYGAALAKPEKYIAVLIGDGELETATALASLNLNKLFCSRANGRVLPILHLNGYKISAPTVYARKSERELMELMRGFGFYPILINGEETAEFQNALLTADELFEKVADGGMSSDDSGSAGGSAKPPLIIMKTEKGAGGPEYVDGQKVAGNYLAHQIPLKRAKTDARELAMLETWLKSYRFEELFDSKKGFML